MLVTAEYLGRVLAQADNQQESLEKIILAVLDYRVACIEFFRQEV